MQSSKFLHTPGKTPQNKQAQKAPLAVDIPTASMQALMLFIGYVPAIAAAIEDISTSLANIDNSLNALAKMQLQKMKQNENCIPESPVSFINDIEEMISDDSEGPDPEEKENEPESD